jgi:hypothetical protein
MTRRVYNTGKPEIRQQLDHLNEDTAAIRNKMEYIKELDIQ